MSSRPARPGVAPWLRTVLLLAPAVGVVIVLFGGGLALGAAQSLGYLPFLDGWHWSLDAYRSLWDDRAVRASLALTLRVSLLATALAVSLGVAAALLVARLGRGRRWMTFVLTSTLPVPHLVGAVTMLILLSQSGVLSRVTFALGLTGAPADFPALTADRFGWGIVADYVWKETPFVAVITHAALSRELREYAEVAGTLGARSWQRLRYVTLPLLAPSIAAASLLVFAFTAGSYEVPALLGSPYPATLPVVALQDYQDSNLSSRPQAMATLMVLAALITVLAAVHHAAVGRPAARRR